MNNYSCTSILNNNKILNVMRVCLLLMRELRAMRPLSRKADRTMNIFLEFELVQLENIRSGKN